MGKASTLTLKLSSSFLSQFLATFLPLAFLTCAGAFYIYCGAQHRSADSKKAHEVISVALGQSALNAVFQEIKRDIQLISQQHALKKLLDNPSAELLTNLEQDMLRFAATSR